MPGQGANVCDLGRAAGLPALSQIKPSLFSDFFNDPADTKINAIAEWLP
jgi:hypothetical protein